MTGNEPPTTTGTDAVTEGPLTLATLRQLVRDDWRALPGTTLVVLSRDTEGNGYSPFATYSHSRYAPLYDGTAGEIYPPAGELERSSGLRELFPDVPSDSVAALVLFPLG
ncbi:hypothetical protein [Streptomyces sp. NPDC093094]|uniref:hypothetical protein n=1 Tax=Streptomyces sp. NPDC093094 TaxID=3366026 RepID=UPI0038131B4F